MKKKRSEKEYPFIEIVHEDGTKSLFLEWCLHCERGIPYHKRGGVYCPFCSASPLDLWDWSVVRKAHPEYPEVPEYGKYYPLN
jgi:hypothetical protein